MTKPESYSHKSIDIDSIMKKSKIRVGNTLNGGPEFILSGTETQDIFEKFANYLVIMISLRSVLDTMVK